MKPDLLEYPDDVIVRYMDAVLGLTRANRKPVERPLSFRWQVHRSQLQFLPGSLLRYLALQSYWRSMIRGAKRTPDLPARVAYHQFFEQLSVQEWTLGGRAHVAIGLLALRTRQSGMEGAVNLYRHMNVVVPRRAIGWSDPVAS